ncbi:hypothetical protein FVA95_27220 [Pseudonocardia sp. EV170527-09]|uniref:hypothetical protein n=1 Tax=Pseudonocardia sp. EV170527-09 TaxID=2603411 RepID=UPI0011F1844B|nr:hypothetical protein [Pseudonocardia sp. EV170527-09]KAA1012697.1 hypothetical protein FVA95_27220 [Pseudonocardia sp. EV170527-09]
MTAATPAPCTHPGADVVARLTSEAPRLWTAIARTGIHDGSLRRGFDLGHDAEQTSLDAAQTVQQTPSLPQP